MMRTFFLFSVLTGILVFTSCSEDRESTTASRIDMIEAVYSSVELEPLDLYKVNASIAGYMDDQKVKEGDLVKAGDLLFVLTNEPAKLNEENAALTYELVRETLEGQSNVMEEMRLELKTARLKAQNDSMNFFRIKALREKNAASQFEYDNSALAYELSSNNVKTLKKRIYRKEIELKNQMGQSRNALNASKLRTNDYFIRSNRNGKIYQVNKEKGEYVNMQEPLALIGDQNEFKLKMLIDEVDISKVSIGQKVLVTLEAYKDKVFEATISEIAPKMDERTQTFGIEARFKKQPSKLYMGLTGEGNIVINEKGSALVIPREYLQPGNKVETEKGTVTVKTGLSNWSYIEILSGLSENQVIYKPK